MIPVFAISKKILQSPLFKRVSSLSQSISERRFQLAEIAYECREERFHVVTEEGRCALWSEVMALALGVDVRRAQELAQIGAFMVETQDYWTFSLTKSPPVYSRVSSAVRYRRVIEDEKLVEMIESEHDYPTVESLQSALSQIAFGTVEYTPIWITKAIRRAMMGGSKLLSLNSDLTPEIRGDITAGVASFSKALETMKGLKK